ncbi:MAG: hypothetical protein ACREJ5_30370 [Geminicoccaceae bacterium]
MARLEKLLGAMRRNPRADWRIEQLKAIADRYGISYRHQPRHVSFAVRGQADRTRATAHQAGLRR